VLIEHDDLPNVSLSSPSWLIVEKSWRTGLEKCFANCKTADAEALSGLLLESTHAFLSLAAVPKRVSRVFPIPCTDDE
jgi:hypothetical protein